jgi:TatA/E family protein of Tat protein translocase
MFNFIKNISPTELIIIATILILIFGSKAVTKLGRTGGETFKEMKKIKRSFTEAIEDDEPQKKGVSK